MSHTDKPTVVLVHGAFADASSFARVIPELISHGQDVVAPAVPNRSLLGDSAYIASSVRQIPGPVILVRHSYGGAVITVAGAEDNVTARCKLAAGDGGPGSGSGKLRDRRPGHHRPSPGHCGARIRVTPSLPRAAPTACRSGTNPARSGSLNLTRAGRGWPGLARGLRVDVLHEPGQSVRVGGRQDAVAEVEDMAFETGGGVEHLAGLRPHGLGR